MCASKMMRTWVGLAVISACLVVGTAYAKVNFKIEYWKTSQGIPVYFVRTPELPMLDIEVVFDAGYARDGHHHGLAAMTAALLDQGARSMSANEIAERFESVGARFDADVNADMTAVHLRTLSKPQFLNSALVVFRKVLSSPTFPERQFKRVKKQFLNLLKRRQGLPAYVAAKHFVKAVYRDQPYGHLALGDLNTVRRLKRRNIRRFYNRYYVARNAKIVIVGDATQLEAKAIAQRINDVLPKGRSARRLPQVKSRNKPVLSDINFPSAQTHILLGQVGISRKDPDYFSLKVGNSILGGAAFTSRLFDEIREKRGLVYHIDSAFRPRQARGPFVIGLQTRNNQAQNALHLTRKVLADFVNQGPTQKELSLAKKSITRGFILRLSSNAAILSNLVNMAFYELPLDFFQTYNSKVKAVTLDAIRSAFSRHIHPKNFVTVLVGRKQ